jgi:hypothetical protein
VKVLGYQPTRRGWLKATGLALVGAPLAKVAWVAVRRRRRRHPDDVPPIPWIGHC